MPEINPVAMSTKATKPNPSTKSATIALSWVRSTKESLQVGGSLVKCGIAGTDALGALLPAHR